MDRDHARRQLGLALGALLASVAADGCAREGAVALWQGRCDAVLYAPQSLDRWFRLTSDVTQGRRGPFVEGHVYNDFSVGAERMRLAIDRLDGSAQAVDCVTIGVPGQVPPAGRAYFTVDVPDASARYRVRVVSFDWANKGGP